MSDPLPLRTDSYGRTVIPEARGKAAAKDAWMAQGGGVYRHSGQFRHGPMKGKTYDQANQEFETMWAGASDAVKEKYAGRSNSDLAPSEIEANRRLISGISPTPANAALKDMSSAGVQKRRMASYGYEFNKDGVAVPIGTKSNTVPSFKALPPGQSRIVQGPPEPTAKTTATKTNAQASIPSFEDLTKGVPATGLDGRIDAVGDGSTKDGKMVTPLAKAPFVPYDMSKIPPGDNSTPFSRMIDSAAAGIDDFRKKAILGGSSAFKPDVQAATDAKGVNDRRAASETARAQAAAAREAEVAKINGIPAPAPFPVGNRAQNIAAAGGDVSKLSTDDRMVAQGKINGGPTPVVKAPTQTPPVLGSGTTADPSRVAPTLATQPATLPPGQRINALRPAPDFTPGAGKELTGMSGGLPTYTNADDLYGKAKPDIGQTIKDTPATADPIKPVMLSPQGMETRRADYEARNQPKQLIPALTPARSTAAADPATPPRATVVESATPQSTADAKVHSMSTEDLEKASGRKFFTGRTLPLDQLVANRSQPEPIAQGFKKPGYRFALARR